MARVTTTVAPLANGAIKLQTIALICMRVFHFVTAEFGLDDLRRRRLKIATLNELNDPFELLAVNLVDWRVRMTMRQLKEDFAEVFGLLCFSRSWRNPVQWSHYAANHSGLCCGFELPAEILFPVIYSRKRLVVEAESLRDGDQISPELIRQFLLTKYSHWKYEQEVRAIVELEAEDHGTGLHFADFSDELRLATVIIGARCEITKESIAEALGDLASTVEIFRARLAFRTFSVVRRRDPKLPKGVWRWTH